MSEVRPKKKALVITGTRADYGLLRPVIRWLELSQKLEPLVLATGMHTLKTFGYTVRIVNKDFKRVRVVSLSPNDSMLKALSKEISGIESVCLKTKPDLILVLGDRDEALAGGIVGSHIGVPVAHIHGGDVSGSVNVDEISRHAITKLSHIHFAATKKSYTRILMLGEEKWRVYNVGSPALDEILTMQRIKRESLAKTLNLNLELKWILVVQHPAPLDRTPIFRQIEETIKSLKEIDAEKIIIYPNSDHGSQIIVGNIEDLRGIKNFHIFRNLPREIFLNVLRQSDMILGNSSAGIIESSFLKVPAINIGDRQMGRQYGKNVIHVRYSRDEIKRAIDIGLGEKLLRDCKKMESPYGRGDSSEKIVKIIEKLINNPRLPFKKLTYRV